MKPSIWLWGAAVLAVTGCYSSATNSAGTQVLDSTTADTAATETAAEAAGTARADTTVAAADATEDAAAQDVAPAEPCGVTVGKTLCDTGLQGYIRNETTGLATEAEFATFTLAEVMAKTTQKYAVVVVGAWW